MKVFVTGVFDLLHVEHVRFLAAAKNQITRLRQGFGGQASNKRQEASQSKNYLIVGVESDKRVRELKGSNRPIIPQDERLELVRAIKFVDEAFIIRRDAESSRMSFDKLRTVNNVSRMEEQEKATTEILEFYKKLLLEIKPEIYAVSENSPHLTTKKLVCQKTGVEFRVVYPENAEVSTSKIIEKIRIM